jgi:hypothetical protein
MPGIEPWATRLVHQRSDHWATRSEALAQIISMNSKYNKMILVLWQQEYFLIQRKQHEVEIIFFSGRKIDAEVNGFLDYL